jgi:hypothetical protein
MPIHQNSIRYRHLVLGVIDNVNHHTYFEGIEIVWVDVQDSKKLRLSCCFSGEGRKLLQDENLKPVFNMESKKFILPVREEILRDWERMGVLKSVLLDRLRLCPKCYALPTFRPACKYCLSARVQRDTLIHHFACAHVDFFNNFEKRGEIICPKCRLKNLVMGSDFEYLQGSYRCNDCQWCDSELEEVGHCLSCGHRFPNHQGHLKDLIGFKIQRLNPKSFFP